VKSTFSLNELIMMATDIDNTSRSNNFIFSTIRIIFDMI